MFYPNIILTMRKMEKCYSQESCWFKLPEATKEFDTFYIYSTVDV